MFRGLLGSFEGVKPGDEAMTRCGTLNMAEMIGIAATMNAGTAKSSQRLAQIAELAVKVNAFQSHHCSSA